MGILESNKLKKVYVDGNAECIYFVQDDSSAYLGANKSQSATIEADFNSDEKIERIKLDIQPEATFTPIQMIEWGQFKLDGFHWQWNKKPKDKWDVIRDSTQYLNYVKEYYSDDPETTGTMDTQEDNENDLPASEKLQPDVEPTIETLDKIQEDIPQEKKATPIQKPNKRGKIRDN
jgi:hypothetical protein